jgi:hypothetical protein
MCEINCPVWSGGPDLNRRPSPWQGDILPLNYHRVNRAKYSKAPGILQHDLLTGF